MKLQEKVKDALDEGRILILGSQIIIGFQWRAVFEKGYEGLPLSAQCLGIVALIAALVLFGLLIAPVCYHNLVSRGQDTNDLHSFATRATESALIPFSGTLGIDLYLSSSTLVSTGTAAAIGIAGLLFALFFWFGLEIMYRSSTAEESSVQAAETTPLAMRIDHSLTEVRMVLPGAQALLGFQFIIFFSESFQKLPTSSKFLHLSSLLLVCVCVVLLMTPAAFHRIVERGEDTERFYRIATRLILAAMVPLAVASSVEFYIVADKVMSNPLLAGLLGGALFSFFVLLWFAYPFYLHRR